MNVVWHNAPGNKAITFTVKMKKGFLNYSRDTRITEPACSMTGILVFCQALAQLHFARVTGRHAFDPVQFFLPSRYKEIWNRIAKAKSYRLN